LEALIIDAEIQDEVKGLLSSFIKDLTEYDLQLSLKQAQAKMEVEPKSQKRRARINELNESIGALEQQQFQVFDTIAAVRGIMDSLSTITSEQLTERLQSLNLRVQAYARPWLNPPKPAFPDNLHDGLAPTIDYLGGDQ